MTRVVGHASRIVPWCAGAAPPTGEGQRTEPHAGARFVIKPGRENSESAPLKTVRASAEGRLDFELPSGTWCLVPADRPSRPSRAGAGDPVCLERLWRHCLAVARATGSELFLEVITIESCSWNQPCVPPGPPPP